MDLTVRKYKFIEQFMQIVNEEKIELFEKILQKEINDEDIVAYTVQGAPLTKKDYIQMVLEADASIDNGNFTSVEDLDKEVKTW